MRISTSWADSEKVACPRCGSISRLHTGVCVSCLLGEGLEAGDEVSRAVFESAIAEIEVPDREWRLGNYEILDEIGRGGTGVIYRARQRHSRRIVAVKRILSYQAESRETLMRFRREAEAVASLDHRNILPIYEVSESEDGLPFFSMKLATGGSLQKVAPALRAEPRRCVQLMAKVARAVEYAHGQGILHRDLKPGNILLDGRGESLVSDFGLAKWLDANKDITKSLTTFGTPGYTAPEQVEGKAAALTPAADVYSLGAILFELLAGRPPFLGSNAVAVIRQAAETPAPKLRSLAHSHNRDLETICVRCLERDPKARYQSAGDLATDLERWLDGRPIVARPVSVSTRLGRWSRRNPKLIATGAACLLFGAATMWFFRGELAKVLPAAPEKSIAVLPFENLSGDPDNAYFADGIQEEILTRLAKIADLKVISRTSTQRYQSKPRNLSQIAKQLGVANILEGSVQEAADQVRVNVQLINALTDSHLWADTYDRKLTHLFAVETEIATKIADTLQAKLTSSEKQAIAVRPTKNSEAHELYLRGRFYFNKGLGPEFDKSRQYYQQAVELDPNYALAYAGLADFYGFAFAVGLLPPDEKWAKMEEYMANKALELDPTLGEAYNPLAAAKLYYYREWATAERDFRRGLELSPNFAEMHAHYAVCLALFSRNQEAFAEMQRALNTDPLSPRFGFWLGWLHFFTRQYDAALKQFRKTLELDSNLPILHEYLGYTYEKKQMHKEAIAEWSKGLRLIGADEDASLLERTYTESGFDAALRALAQKRLETFKEKTGRGEYVPAHEYVVAYMRLDDKEQAFAWLAKAFAERNRFAFEITVNPIFDSLRSDPRFEKIVTSLAPK